MNIRVYLKIGDSIELDGIFFRVLKDWVIVINEPIPYIYHIAQYAPIYYLPEIKSYNDLEFRHKIMIINTCLDDVLFLGRSIVPIYSCNSIFYGKKPHTLVDRLKDSTDFDDSPSQQLEEIAAKGRRHLRSLKLKL